MKPLDKIGQPNVSLPLTGNHLYRPLEDPICVTILAKNCLQRDQLTIGPRSALAPWAFDNLSEGNYPRIGLGSAHTVLRWVRWGSEKEMLPEVV